VTQQADKLGKMIAKNSKCTGREKASEKKRQQIFTLPNLCDNQLIST
jgi:hypothetical protein